MCSKRISFVAFAVFATTILLSGCMEMTGHTERLRVSTEGEIFKYAQANLPPLANGSTRIYFYRPQVLVGFLASPIVIVNGHWMGTKGNRNDNLFLPGTVFIVDCPDTEITAWLYQAGKENTERKISIRGGENKTYFVRNKMHMTYVDLEIVDKKTAMSEIEALHLSGYRNLRSH